MLGVGWSGCGSAAGAMGAGAMKGRAEAEGAAAGTRYSSGAGVSGGISVLTGSSSAVITEERDEPSVGSDRAGWDGAGAPEVGLGPGMATGSCTARCS